MDKVLLQIKLGESLTAVRSASHAYMHECCRALSGFAGTEMSVERLTIERWWSQTVFCATTDPGLDDCSRWIVVQMMAGCVNECKKY